MNTNEELKARIAELEAQQAVLVDALGKTASHIEAMMVHIEHKPQRFKEHCWSQAVAARAALAAVKPAEKRCEYCDGTGDVHRGDGQWLGFCTCPAGKEGGDRG